LDINNHTPRGGPKPPSTPAESIAGSAVGPAVDDCVSSGIQVYVRVRPFSRKELEEEQSRGCAKPQPVVEFTSDARTVNLYDPSAPDVERGQFMFDYCMSPFKSNGVKLDNGELSESEDEEDLAEVAQEECYALAGAPILQASWAGFNGCVFAYGQTNSGKTYTMMGTKRDPGLIPRLCRQLFERLEDQTEAEQKGGGKKKTTTVQVTYMEIYNEQVMDLLKPRPKVTQQRFNSRFDQHAVDEYQSLKVRQHPLHGPFVEGISRVDVKCWLECVQLIRAGNELRSQTHTNMNDNSSRSHAIFQIIVTHTEAMGAKVRGKTVTNHRVSKLNLVDLAGSERLVKSGVTGKHVTEATHINQSLSTLRKVMDSLIQNSKAKAAGKKPSVIPYRESLLTWILADNFGGNSKTIMIATVSPACSSWHETESTLRYATLARGVVNRVRVNEDPSTKLIRELQAQLRALQEEIVQVRIGTLTSQPDEARQAAQAEKVRELEEHIEMNSKAMDELHQREDILRNEMMEYKNREQELLQKQEELRKGEAYWRNKAQELTVESEKLRGELERVKSHPELEGSGNGQSLRLTKEDKKMFWLDEPAAQEAAKQTELLKKRRKEKVLTNYPVAISPPLLEAHKEPQPEWSELSPDVRKVKQDPTPEKSSLEKRRQTQPLIGLNTPQEELNLAPRPTSEGPLGGGEKKHGRRANTGDSSVTASIDQKHGRRAHSHLTGELVSLSTSAVPTSLVARTPVPVVSPTLPSTGTAGKTVVRPVIANGTDALDKFLKQPVSVPVRNAK
jgi:hypothetical protein